MADPLTDKQLAEIRRRGEMARRESQQDRRDRCTVSLGLLDLPCYDVRALLDEVERLKKELDTLAVRRNFGDLTARNKELEDLFHLQQSRMGEAVEHWRRSTGRDDATPSLGDLLAFLLKDIEWLKASADRLACFNPATGQAWEETPEFPETIEILADPEAMKQLKQSEQDVKDGKLTDQDEVEKQSEQDAQR